ncbi:MAG: hypothetical protein F6K10_00965 [Moorea sp. SIO2B7]|nr:hypothetical protein [Moorena sp. SIO2B7]
MPKPPKRFSLELLLLSAIAIAVLLRIINLGSREFWYDEVLSLLLCTGQKIAYKSPPDFPVVLADYTPLLSLPVENGIGDILKTLASLLRGLAGEPHPPLFFLGQHLWLRIFGNGEAAMRSLEALYSVGAIACAYGLGRCLLRHRGGLMFAALLGINNYYLFHSLNVRMYSPLVFWIVLSAWAALQLIETNKSTNSPNYKLKILWTIILITSITGGLMSFYLFVYYLVALAVLVVFLDRQRWWQYGLCLSAGVLITIPWVLWGTRQQLRNADFGRFSASTNFLATSWRHLEDVLQTLGIHLILGDWISSLPPVSATIAGVVAVALLLGCSISLWRQKQRRLLAVALLLGIFPLLLALGVDFVKNQFTLGFGWGRSMILILPGCLLLLVVWLERGAGKWQKLAIVALLLLYLSISITDLYTRPRWMFHQIADIIEQEPTKPTLIAMNSRAWGHVMRLAYYLPPTSPVMLIARNSADLATTLDKTLSAETNTYPRLIWLDSARPVWSAPKTEAKKIQFQQEIKTVINSRYQLQKTEKLSGTMELDKFNVHIYELSDSLK